MTSRCNAPALLLSLFAFWGMACDNSSSSASTDSPPAVDSLSEAEETDLFLQLSGYLLPDGPERAVVENNLLVNLAMDSLWAIQRAPTGFYYQILETGTGDTLRWGDRIRVHYRGTFPNGEAFDNTYRRGKPFTAYIGNMISGWNQGLQLIRPGGRIRLLIPSALGYGAEGLQQRNGQYLVPPDQPLIFEAEVVEVVERGEY